MYSNLKQLVEFLHHGNTQIRQIGERALLRPDVECLLRTVSTPATENLVGYSTSQPSIFKAGHLTPIKDLKLLVKDYTVRVTPAVSMYLTIQTPES